MRIASCESGDGHGSINWVAQNPTSSASGGFQFVDGTWQGLGYSGRAKDAAPATQIQAFYKLWRGGAGAGNWAPSRACWG